jgi:hypothetical protein
VVLDVELLLGVLILDSNGYILLEYLKICDALFGSVLIVLILPVGWFY